MTTQILRLRSTLLYDRVFPNRLGQGEFAVNLNPNEPGIYFADSNASPGLIKVGPTHVGSEPPNVLPSGYPNLCKGESWLDKSSTNIFKVFDGTSFQPVNAVASTSTTGFPSNPVDGQLHYDKSVPGLHIYNGTTGSWVLI